MLSAVTTRIRTLASTYWRNHNGVSSAVVGIGDWPQVRCSTATLNVMVFGATLNAPAEFREKLKLA
jgi:hypothetical protein